MLSSQNDIRNAFGNAGREGSTKSMSVDTSGPEVVVVSESESVVTQVAVTATATVTSRPGSVVASEGSLSASVGGCAVTSTAKATAISTSQHVVSTEAR